MIRRTDWLLITVCALGGWLFGQLFVAFARWAGGL